MTRFALPVLAVLTAGPLLAADPDPAKLAALRARMQAFVDDGELAGIVTVVGRSDGLLSHEALGKLKLDGAPMPKNAVFRIASMTKPITALAIAMLVDEGKLSVEDDVAKHLPEFAGQMLKSGTDVTKPSRPIQVRDLLTHTSGMPGGMPPEMSNLYAKRDRTLKEAVAAFAKRPLDFEPGSKWAYCNPGIDTLGRIVEVLSGQSYEDFLHKRIFGPLQMVDTTFYPTKEQLDRTVPVYDRKEGKLVAPANLIIGPPAGAKYPIPAGGLYSTGEDLAKLYQMLLNKGTKGNVRFVSEKSLAEMTRVQTGDIKTGFVDGMGFGFGFAVVREPKGVTGMLSAGTYGHGGAFGTQGWIDPKKDLFVVLLIQRVGIPNADASKMRQALQEAAVAIVE